MTCELIDVDIEKRKVRVNCDGFEKEIDIDNNCRIIQQGKNPPKTVMVKCDERKND